jgi:hypothetical protein
MGHSFFVVQANAVAGEDTELNRWYEEQHLDDCLACEAAVATQRFQKLPDSGTGPYAYLALYEVEDPQTFADDRRRKEGTPLLPRTPALALPAHAFFYRPAAGQPELLARPVHSLFYIEYLDAGSSKNAAALMLDRQKALQDEPGLGASELMLVDDYQERQGWHADGIIFAEIVAETGETWRPAALQADTAGIRIAESGLYRSVSAQRLKP